MTPVYCVICCALGQAGDARPRMDRWGMKAQERSSAGEVFQTSILDRTSTDTSEHDEQAWSKQKMTSPPLGKTTNRAVGVNVDVEACVVASQEV